MACVCEWCGKEFDPNKGQQGVGKHGPILSTLLILGGLSDGSREYCSQRCYEEATASRKRKERNNETPSHSSSRSSDKEKYSSKSSNEEKSSCGKKAAGCGCLVVIILAILVVVIPLMDDDFGKPATTDIEKAQEGVRYYTGKDVEKNIDKGLALMRKSAKARCGFGQFILGMALLEQGGHKNELEAVEWLEKAVESGENDKNNPDDDEKWIDDARLYLGICYVVGKGLPPKASREQYESKGRKLLAIAAHRGHEKAGKAVELFTNPPLESLANP